MVAAASAGTDIVPLVAFVPAQPSPDWRPFAVQLAALVELQVNCTD
jgi:hypothetical protein